MTANSIKIIVVLCFCIVARTTASPISATVPTSCMPGTEKTDTGCSPCKNGTYSKDGSKCQKCSVCHRGQIQDHPCEGTRNSYCVCPKGKYEWNGVCVACTMCQPGSILIIECSHNLDSTCTECPKGQTTNTTNSKQCHPMSKSPGNTEVHQHFHSTSNLNIIAYCLTAFFVGILICAIVYFKCCKKKRQPARHEQLEVHFNNDDNEDDVFGADDEEQDLMPDSISPERPNLQHRDYEDLTADISEDLCMLNNEGPNNWKVLAGKLNFTLNDVGRFQLNPSNAVQDMLYEYSTGRNATVFRVYSALQMMGREDAARILRPHIYK